MELEVYNKLFDWFMEGKRLFSVTELLKELRSTRNEAVQPPLRALLQDQIIRAVGKETYAFQCDYYSFRAVWLARNGTEEIAESASDMARVTKEELWNTAWMVNRIVPAAREEDRAHESSKDFMSVLTSLEDDTPKLDSLNRTFDADYVSEAYRLAKERLSNYVATRPHGDDETGSFRLFMPLSYPSGKPFDISIMDSKDDMELYFTDSGGTYRFLIEMLGPDNEDAAGLVDMLLVKFGKESTLKYLNNAMCMPIDFFDWEGEDDREIEFDLYVMIQRINEFLADEVSWITSPTTSAEDFDSRLVSYVQKTLKNRYSYEGGSSGASLDKVATAFCERLLKVDHRLTRRKAIATCMVMKDFWMEHKASKETIDVISAVQRKYEECDQDAFNIWKIKLYSKDD